MVQKTKPSEFCVSAKNSAAGSSVFIYQSLRAEIPKQTGRDPENKKATSVRIHPWPDYIYRNACLHSIQASLPRKSAPERFLSEETEPEMP